MEVGYGELTKFTKLKGPNRIDKVYKVESVGWKSGQGWESWKSLQSLQAGPLIPMGGVVQAHVPPHGHAL